MNRAHGVYRVLVRVPARLYLLLVVALGWLNAYAWDLHEVSRSSAYLYATSLLLAVGLYGSTQGIDYQQARQHRRIIVAAVTVGVVAKAALIGGALALATRDPLYLILGVAVAQIDPLSVATLLGDDRLSPRVKTILASWASFDDPVTVVLTVYAATIATRGFGLTGSGVGLGIGAVTSGGVAGYLADLAVNLLVAGLAAVVWWRLRHRTWLVAITLIALAVLAVGYFLMLAVAISGLFIRFDRAIRVITALTQWALYIAAAMLGLLLVSGVDLVGGALLGVLSFLAQVLVGSVLSRGLPRLDRVHLALAQQNGITAIILALRLESQYAGAAAVIAPAILVTNVVHVAANWIADRVDRATTRQVGPAAPDPP